MNQLDAALERAAATVGNPGVQAVAMRDGQLIWSAGRGLAVADPPVPVTDSTMFAFASFGKLMLTAFVLDRVEAGMLDLDKPIATYIGDELPGSHAVTIRMLLTHTAGYPDLYSDPEIARLFPPGGPGSPSGDLYDPNRPYTFAMLSPGIREPVDPGVRFEYSNTGFIVLGRVLSKVSGGDAALRLAYTHFVQPAGAVLPMTEDLVTMERSDRALQRFAHGYTPLADGTLEDFFTTHGAKGIPTDLYGFPFTDGVFAGTALGAAQLLDGLFVRDRLLSPAAVREMTTPTPQAVESPEFGGTYGMGTSRDVVSGRTWQGHGGSYVGFNSMGATDIERGVTIVVLVNQLTPARPADVIWKALAEAYASGTG